MGQAVAGNLGGQAVAGSNRTVAEGQVGQAEAGSLGGQAVAGRREASSQLESRDGLASSRPYLSPTLAHIIGVLSLAE